MEVSCGGAGPTRAEMGGARIDKVNESCTSIEFGEEEGGVGLGFRGGDPLETRSECAIFAAAFAEDSAPIAAHSHFLERESNAEREKLNIYKMKIKRCGRREVKGIYLRR